MALALYARSTQDCRHSPRSRRPGTARLDRRPLFPGRLYADGPVPELSPISMSPCSSTPTITAPTCSAPHPLLARRLRRRPPQSQKAARVEPKSVEAHQFLSEAYAKLGQQENGAREHAAAERLKSPPVPKSARAQVPICASLCRW